MKELLIATWNSAKKNMYLEMLKWENIKLIFLDDLEKISSPKEEEKTVEGNALFKAKYYFDIYKIPCLADDAWFEIDELNWEPWIKARRWWWVLPDNVSDEDWTLFFLEKIKNIKSEPFSWSFPYSRCLYLWENNYFFQNWKIPVKFSHFKQREPKKWRPSWAFLLEEYFENDSEQRWKSELIAFLREKFL